MLQAVITFLPSHGVLNCISTRFPVVCRDSSRIVAASRLFSHVVPSTQANINPEVDAPRQGMPALLYRELMFESVQDVELAVCVLGLDRCQSAKIASMDASHATFSDVWIMAFETDRVYLVQGGKASMRYSFCPTTV